MINNSIVNNITIVGHFEQVEIPLDISCFNETNSHTMYEIM
jgi:hypothetical protein